MSRSTKKGPYINDRLLKKIEDIEKKGKKQPVKTWARNSTIPPEFVGHTFNLHNGKIFVPVFVTESMVGHKLGEFAATRTFRGHGEKKSASTLSNTK